MYITHQCFITLAFPQMPHPSQQGLLDMYILIFEYTKEFLAAALAACSSSQYYVVLVVVVVLVPELLSEISFFGSLEFFGCYGAS